MFHIFLIIVFWNLSLLLRQWDIMEKTRYMSKMVSYNHNGMKTMNQDHLTLLSNLRASKIRNIKHMNHVKSALCRTAIVFKCSFFVDYVSKSQRLTAQDSEDIFSENVEEAHYTSHKIHITVKLR